MRQRRVGFPSLTENQPPPTYRNPGYAVAPLRNGRPAAQPRTAAIFVSDEKTPPAPTGHKAGLCGTSCSDDRDVLGYKVPWIKEDQRKLPFDSSDAGVCVQSQQ